MKAIPSPVFSSLHGKVLGDKAGCHVRTNPRTGHGYICRNPKAKPLTDKQKAQTSKMKEANAYYRQVMDDPVLHDQLFAEFRLQSTYHRFYDFVRSKILCNARKSQSPCYSSI